ncbi:ubiquitin carboxyl-terminal hydrolase 3-like [Tubulanus polymorphus]|uniref:ubiquitin carboxyl-terminal hydrolase 3-like n=1 Tax=Tubulanus polymorphus TaxID=672921 RepID=UPI003DA359C4
MECPHLTESICITTPSSIPDGSPSDWCCSACKTNRSPWMCLACGVVNCGRYVSAHALRHYEEDRQHCVCLDCQTYVAFCYACDDFVINDTSSNKIDQVRKVLQDLESAHKSNRENQDTKRRKTSVVESAEYHKKLKTDDGATKKPRSSGLRNLGNTCFMNAVLQSLSNIHEFCGYIKQLPPVEKPPKRKVRHTRRTKEEEDFLLVEELRKTLIALWQGSKQAISPDNLFSVIWKVVPRFRGYQQQDAHEFMRYLLDRLHTELLTLLPYPDNNSPYIGPKNKSTIVTAIFGGLLQNEVNCLICGMESKKHDPFLDLSLDIPPEFSSSKSKGGDLCNLSDCLKSFTDVEELEESELYMCSNCKLKQRSTKKFWIRSLPNVLCLHLKRFRWSTYFRVKVETYVHFPVRGLDMSRYVLDNLHETRNSFLGSNEYDLAAVIVHHGSGAGSGHYTAYAMHEGRWYNFNDSTVTVCDEETVAKCKAYILFYVRRELKLPDYLTPHMK